MLGIPFVVRRFSERGCEDETVFLRTRRCGPAGEKMRVAIRRYHAATFFFARRWARLPVGGGFCPSPGAGDFWPSISANF